MNELEKRMGKKTFKPMQRGGVYDPMEQAGHRDAIFVKSVKEIIEEMKKGFPKFNAKIVEGYIYDEEDDDMEEWIQKAGKWFNK